MSIKIYIDQGHNPRDFNTGAVGNGYFEQDITYDIGKRLFALLSQNPNFTPRLSRPTADTVLGFSNSSSLQVRVNEANEWGADVFISLHTNASDNANASGAEVLIYSLDLPIPRELGTDILEELTSATGLRNRGLKERPGLYVLRRTAMPALLVEMGFITNSTDADLMVNSPELFARGIYRGILKYYG
jgi:N-acetylmuramoyl-L-alanine amidase